MVSPFDTKCTGTFWAVSTERLTFDPKCTGTFWAVSTVLWLTCLAFECECSPTNGAFLKTQRHKNICPFTVNICLFNLKINPILCFSNIKTQSISNPPGGGDVEAVYVCDLFTHTHISSVPVNRAKGSHIICVSYRKKDLKCVICHLSSVVRCPSSVVRRLYLLSSHVSTLVHRIINFTLRSIG